MPLHAEIKSPVRVSNRFDDAVLGSGHDPQASGVGNRLTVMTLDLTPSQFP